MLDPRAIKKKPEQRREETLIESAGLGRLSICADSGKLAGQVNPAGTRRTFNK